jgi:acetyl-CoA/propionyl-CoA carboxylase carboxyl transferase subunit
VTGERVSPEDLGGPEIHGRRSGVAHVVAGSESDALARARRLTALFARPGLFSLPGDGEAAQRPDLRSLLPETARRAYDVRPLLTGLLDSPALGSPALGSPARGPALEELQPGWAPNIVIGLGRLGGRTVGVVANNPLRLGGCLNSPAAEKAARFVRMCDAFGIPLLVVVDVPGYLPGVRQEWEGVVRRGAKLLHAFSECTVPRATLVTRKAYGGAYIAMNSRALGATAVLAWREAEVAVMGTQAAVDILHRKKLAAARPEQRETLRSALAGEHERIAGGVGRALAIGVVDEVIDPSDSRQRLIRALAAAPARRDVNPHGNIPL